MGKFYWLKLKRDFFKRHDVRIIRGKPNGEKMLLFYLELLCESVDHEGELRFSEEVPYDNEMLASVTGTEICIVNETINLLQKLKMMTIEEDGTMIMSNLENMLGCETSWAEKKRQQRTRQGQSEDNARTMSPNCPPTEGTMSDKRLEIRDKRKDIKSLDKREKEKEREKAEDESSVSPSKSRTRFSPPTLEEVKAYCDERHNGIDPEHFWNWYASKNWYVGKNKMTDWKAAVRTWESRRRDEPEKKKEIPIMENEYSKEHLERKEHEDLESILSGLLDD